MCRARRMPQRPRAPHLNVVIFCSLLRVHKHLEASLTNITRGAHGDCRVKKSVVCRNIRQSRPSPLRFKLYPAYAHLLNVWSLPRICPQFLVMADEQPRTAPGGQANRTRRVNPTVLDEFASRARRACQVHQRVVEWEDQGERERKERTERIWSGHCHQKYGLSRVGSELGHN